MNNENVVYSKQEIELSGRMIIFANETDAKIWYDTIKDVENLDRCNQVREDMERIKAEYNK